MSKIEIEYSQWKSFNSSLRFLGFVFTLIGGSWGARALLTIFFPAKFIDIMDSVDAVDRGISVIFPLCFAFIGVLMMTVKPYFPKHIKEWLRENELKLKDKS
jgi:hypothetical protein